MSKKKRAKRMSKDTQRTALFICRCGSNVADIVDVETLKQDYEAKGIPIVTVDDHFCSEQGIQTLIKAIKKSKAERAVFAGCSPLLHWDLLSEAAKEAGLDPGHFHMANIREQGSWVHWNDTSAATAKAKATIDTGLAFIRDSNPISTQEVPVTRRALVIGGGVAGMNAALTMADAGIETVIVEREGFLGGHMAKWDKLFPTFDCGICILGPMMTRVARHPLIKTMTLSEVINVRGTVGNYRVTIRQAPRFVDIDSCTGCDKCIDVCPVEVIDEYNYGLGKRKAMVRPSVDAVPLAPYIDSNTCVGCQSCAGVCEPKSLRYEDEERAEAFEFGAIIVATGFKPFDAKRVEEYGYGENPDVITSLEFERLINPEGPTAGRVLRPSNGKVPKNIVFVPCVGSRSERFGNPYCSRVCCTAAVKEVAQFKQHLPDSDAYVFYVDMRVFGKGYEELYEKTSRDYRVNFIRGTLGEVVQDPITGKTLVRAEDTLLRRDMEFEADLVVLMVGMEPDSSNVPLSLLLKTPLDENGFFMEQHPKLRPSSTASKGVYLAGVVQGPKDIADTIAHSGLAASKAMVLLSKGDIVTEACIPSFDQEPCLSCRLCEQTCNADAIRFDNDYPTISQAACRACGACVAACPSGALDLPCLTNKQLVEATKAAVEFNPVRPAIVGYLCRWCAYSAADKAGTSRLTYPSNMIPIKVPCTGRLNAETILTAFSEGADGVAILGCHEQDCHYRSGAKQAKSRTETLREVIEAAGIDGRRLYFGSASASESDSFAEQVTNFVTRIMKLGPLGTEMPDERRDATDATASGGK
ncbi:MAG: hydrogenase iron-sulfur subunit [Candidatus Thorarchaeota archaeon]